MKDWSSNRRQQPPFRGQRRLAARLISGVRSVLVSQRHRPTVPPADIRRDGWGPPVWSPPKRFP
jgi:hypothetical protein